MTRLNRSQVQPLIRQALAEDRVRRDVTSRAVLTPDARVRAPLVANAPGLAAGIPVAVWVFKTVDRALRCQPRVRDGTRIRPGQILLRVEGRARSILAAERTALNFLGHLSGIATLTSQFVSRVPRATKILDTRKTLPALRALEKYAVSIGGGLNHRSNLSEAILIKTNHLKALRARSSPQSTVHGPQLIRKAIAQAKRARPRRFVEIEVTNLREFNTALGAKPDAILLDNWSLTNIRKAVALRHRGPWTVDRGPRLEVSGGVTLANVRAIARTGVDRISIGRLTHSAPALDVSLEVVAKN